MPDKNWQFELEEYIKVYLPNLPASVTVAFWTSWHVAHLSAIQALLLGFCSSGYDFAIASSRPHLTI